MLTKNVALIVLPPNPNTLVNAFEGLGGVTLIPWANDSRHFCSDVMENSSNRLLFQLNLLPSSEPGALILCQTHTNQDFFMTHFPNTIDRYYFFARWFNEDIFQGWLNPSPWKFLNIYNPTQGGTILFKKFVGSFKTHYQGVHEVLTRELQ